MLLKVATLVVLLACGLMITHGEVISTEDNQLGTETTRNDTQTTITDTGYLQKGTDAIEKGTKAIPFDTWTIHKGTETTQNATEINQNGPETIETESQTLEKGTGEIEIETGSETTQKGTETIQIETETTKAGNKTIQNGTATAKTGAKMIPNGTETVGNTTKNVTGIPFIHTTHIGIGIRPTSPPWQDLPPTTCEGRPCLFGTCETILKSNVPSYECKCDAGFIGKHCDAQDPCLAHVCANSATCQPQPNGHGDPYTCLCPSGFIGRYCNNGKPFVSIIGYQQTVQETQPMMMECSLVNLPDQGVRYYWIFYPETSHPKFTSSLPENQNNPEAKSASDSRSNENTEIDAKVESDLEAFEVNIDPKISLAPIPKATKNRPNTDPELASVEAKKVTDAALNNASSVPATVQNNTDTKLGSVPSELDSVPSELDSVPQEFGSVPQEFGSVAPELDSVPSELDSVPSELDSVPQEFGSVAPELDSVPQEFGSVPQEFGSVPQEFGSVPPKLGSVPSTIEEASDAAQNKPRLISHRRVLHRSAMKLTDSGYYQCLVISKWADLTRITTVKVTPKASSSAVKKQRKERRILISELHKVKQIEYIVVLFVILLSTVAAILARTLKQYIQQKRMIRQYDRLNGAEELETP